MIAAPAQIIVQSEVVVLRACYSYERSINTGAAVVMLIKIMNKEEEEKDNRGRVR